MPHQLKKLLAVMVAGSMVMSMLTMQVSAASSVTESGTGTMEDPTVKVTVTVNEEKDALSGQIKTQTETQTDWSGSDEASGSTVEGSEVKKDEVVTDSLGRLLTQSGTVSGAEHTEEKKTETETKREVESSDTTGTKGEENTSKTEGTFTTVPGSETAESSGITIDPGYAGDVTVQLTPGSTATGRAEVDEAALAETYLDIPQEGTTEHTDPETGEKTTTIVGVTEIKDNAGKVIGYSATKTTTTAATQSTEEKTPVGTTETVSQTGETTTRQDTQVSILLPEKPAEGVHVDPSTGRTTRVTVTEIVDLQGNVVGYRSETVVTDAAGKKIGSGSESVWGTKTTKVTTTTTPTTTTTTAREQVTTTTTTVITQGTTVLGQKVVATDREVQASMGNICIVSGDGSGIITDKEIGLTPINPSWNADKEQVKAPRLKLTDEKIRAALANKPDGYDFLYIGAGEDSLYGASWNFDEEDENYVDGYYATGTAQFQLGDFSGENSVDAMKTLSAYCADVDTTSKLGYWYRIANLEDAGYYQDETAENHIRAIALNGYWGATGTDETGNPVTGSLEALKQTLKNDESCTLSDEEIDALTEGEALTATQMAIWQYGNPYDTESIYFWANTYDVGSPEWITSNQVLKDTYGMTSQDIADAKARIDAVAGYLTGLSMTAEEAGSTEIISVDKFIDQMSLTVKEQIEDHANNLDENQENDAYHVDLNFSLMVIPGQTDDDLIVKVIDADGNVLRTARLAGDDSNDVGFGKVQQNDDGSYTLGSLELIEGQDINFNLKLEGAQYLEQGVYIYTSQTIENVPSQTFVGVAEGYHAVDLSMDVNLKFEVEEATASIESSRTGSVQTKTDTSVSRRTDTEVTQTVTAEIEITTETVTETDRTWEGEYLLSYKYDGGSEGGEDDDTDEDPRTEPEKEPEEERAPEEIVPDIHEPVPDVPQPEEPVSQVPRTGDAAGIWLALSGVSGCGLAGIYLFGKRRKEAQEP